MADTKVEVQPPATPESRLFNITAKTSHAELMEYANPGADFGLKQAVARDMMANARELTDSVDWGEVSQHFKASRRGKPVTGEAALINSGVTPRLGLIARELGVGMDDPRVVYLSGAHAAWSLDADVRHLDRRVQEIESGKRKFMSEDAKQQALTQAKTEAARLATYSARIKEAMAAYAENQFISPKQQKLFREMLYADPSRTKQVKKAARLLKDGKPDEAQKLIFNKTN